MNILIIGGAGFLGNNLIRRCLQEKKQKITVVDSLDPRLRSDIRYIEELGNAIDFIKGDLCDAKLMGKVVQGKDIIFNCAAQTSHPESFKDPFFDVEVNCHGNLTLLEAIRVHNPKTKVIYTSSSTVIGKAVGETVSENHGEYPLDIYSANKGVAEKYYYIYNKVYDIKTLTLRFANLYGAYGKGYPEFGFINYFIALANANKKITLYGKGNQIRNVMYAEDAADLLYQSAFNEKIFGDLYFAVHNEHYSIKEIADSIVKAFGKGKVTHVDWPDLRKRIEIDNVIISGAKLFYDMKWEPKYNLIEGLKKTKQIMDQLQEGRK